MIGSDRAPRRPRPVTASYLDRAALYYLGRYASSAENLRRVLLRKVKRRLLPDEVLGPDLEALVGDTVERALRTGLLDDRTYAEARTASLMRRGTSPRGIRARLRDKGVGADAITAAIDEAAPDELALARRLAERRRFGPWRSPGRPAAPEKELAALCRAGFSPRIARAALADPDE